MMTVNDGSSYDQDDTLIALVVLMLTTLYYSLTDMFQSADRCVLVA